MTYYLKKSSSMCGLTSLISTLRSLASLVSFFSMALKTLEREHRNALCTGKDLSSQTMVKSDKLSPLLLNDTMSSERLSRAIDRTFSEVRKNMV